MEEKTRVIFYVKLRDRLAPFDHIFETRELAANAVEKICSPEIKSSHLFIQRSDDPADVIAVKRDEIIYCEVQPYDLYRVYLQHSPAVLGSL